VAGRNVLSPQYATRFNLTFPGAEFTEYDGDPGNVTTLDHILWMSDLAPNVTIADVMDVGGNVICGEYFYDE
jgi:tyrosinase